MRRFICLIFGIILLTQSAHAVNADAAAVSRKALTNSAKTLRDVCQNVRNGLRYEYYFLNFFNYECSYYDAKRLRTRDAIFPIVNNIVKGYNEEYPKITTDFILEMDRRQLEYYQLLVENYCKYNEYKMKDTTGCSAASIKSYFDVKL